MSTIAILGSGFGLYGYLPALISLGHRIALPERYRLRFEARPELRDYSQDVQWAEDELSALRISSGAVLALCPAMQCQWLATCLDQPQLERLFLEKPLAPNPRAAAELQTMLVRSRKVIRIAYLFRYLDWASKIKQCLSQETCSSLRLQWHFRAHHFREGLQTWKREVGQGGGPVRFFGIHVVAMLAEFGYTTVVCDRSIESDQLADCRWTVALAGANLPVFEVELDTDSDKSEFSVIYQNQNTRSPVVQSCSPFGDLPVAHMSGGLDSRVTLLEKLCRSAWDEPMLIPEFYGRTIELWNEVEHAATSTRCVAA